MPSKKLKAPLRPDRYYHIYNRGNNKESLFHNSSDYYFFLGRYKHYISPFADTYCYCLLPNHFHFLIKTREEVSRAKSVVPNQLRKLFICYSSRVNYTHGRVGSLFTKNYQRIEIADESYLQTLVKYIHKNPVKHGVKHDFRTYPYSSFHYLADGKDTFLIRNDVYKWFGGKKEFLSYHFEDEIDYSIFNFSNIEEAEEEL